MSYVQGDSKLEVQNLRRDSAHHKDLELHRNPSSQSHLNPLLTMCSFCFLEMWAWLLNAESLANIFIFK